MALLGDIAFNRGRIIKRLLNIALQFAGSALQVAPC
jgi:hypothetical protein